jgi:thiazole synthase ThiGH ThiG subunit
VAARKKALVEVVLVLESLAALAHPIHTLLAAPALMALEAADEAEVVYKPLRLVACTSFLDYGCSQLVPSASSLGSGC